MSARYATPAKQLVKEAEGYKLHLSSTFNDTGYKGVREEGSRYRARYAGESLGLFDTAVKAAVAYAKHVKPPLQPQQKQGPSSTNNSNKRPRTEEAAEAEAEEPSRPEVPVLTELRNDNPARIWLQGFVETPRLLRPILTDKLLTMVRKPVDGEPISNSSQMDVDEETLKLLNAVLQASPVVRTAVQAKFDTPYFDVSVAKLLLTPPGMPPQLPHAADDDDRALFGIVHLADGQAPTRCEPYDAAKMNGIDTSQSYEEQLHEKFGELLEDDATNLCKHACGALQPAAGDGMLALTTLVHREPGTIGSPKDRNVLFYSVRPLYDDEERQNEEEESYDPEAQIDAGWILVHSKAMTAEDKEKVRKIYKEAGYNLEAHEAQITPKK